MPQIESPEGTTFACGECEVAKVSTAKAIVPLWFYSSFIRWDTERIQEVEDAI